MAGWMSGGTKGVKSRWVTIVVDRDEIDHSIGDDWGTTFRDLIKEYGGRIYGE